MLFYFGYKCCGKPATLVYNGLLVLNIMTWIKYIRPGQTTPRGLIIEETEEDFVVVSRSYSEAVKKVDIGDILEVPDRIPKNVALLKHLEFLHPLTGWKSNGELGYLAITLSGDGTPYLVGAELKDERFPEGERRDAITFSKLVGRKENDLREGYVYERDDSYSKTQEEYANLNFDSAEVDEKGLPKLIRNSDNSSSLYSLDRWGLRPTEEGSSIRVDPFSPLTFSSENFNGKNLFLDNDSREGLLITTKTIPKEELFNGLIGDCYRLLDTNKGPGQYVDFLGVEALCIPKQEVRDTFWLME